MVVYLMLAVWCTCLSDKKQDGSVENRKKGKLLAHTHLYITTLWLSHLPLCIKP